MNLANIASSTEDKAKACREFVGKKFESVGIALNEEGKLVGSFSVRDVRNPGAWAFKYEGRFYCFMPNEKASCAGEKSRIIKQKLYSASTGFVEETARHYVCGVRR